MSDQAQTAKPLVANTNDVSRTDLVGIKGWLLLLAMGQTISPLIVLGGMAENAKVYAEIASVPGASFAYGVELLMNVVFVGFNIFVTVMMYRKSAKFPMLYTYQWLAGVALVLVDTAIISSAFGISFSQVLAVYEPKDWGRMIGGILWVWYVHQSIRVRNTMVN